MGADIEMRKTEHIRIAENESVTSERNFWDDIRLVHQALPEMDFDSITTDSSFLDFKLDFPIIISSMTGGTQLAKKINMNLARAAEHFGIGMGVGSMRAAVVERGLADTFNVISDYNLRIRIANIGAPQLVDQGNGAFSDRDIEYIYNLIDANLLVVHFNFLQEMVQPEGDHKAEGVLKRVKEIAASYPIVAKETGNGFSMESAMELRDAGAKAIDVGGLGGTSFAAIEYYRAKNAGNQEKMQSGRTFWNWGVPSPASIRYCSDILPVIGSGGLRNGLDLAKSILLGAEIGGFARTLLKGADESFESIQSELSQIIRDLKITMFLTKSKKVKDLRRAKHLILEPLKTWMEVYNGK